ncbi:MAG: hypothetical protein DMG15_01030 [Acidobacteria bacterium]|nr:MAG: hypothetical protein DMG15_01030 [Acidobacteriota bacterium]
MLNDAAVAKKITLNLENFLPPTRMASDKGTAIADSFPSKANAKKTTTQPMRRSASAINANNEKKQASRVDRS